MPTIDGDERQFTGRIHGGCLVHLALGHANQVLNAGSAPITRTIAAAAPKGHEGQATTLSTTIRSRKLMLVAGVVQW